MAANSSKPVRIAAPPPNNLRPDLDDIDRRILGHLAADARIPNNALADLVGIAPSTCLSRVRALR
ncbi:MAG: hypothetical protein QOF87_343, partial [Pseudonocardiales bacterium]|nr:hypothetical protein [Pseudonocardiales bacterium]